VPKDEVEFFVVNTVQVGAIYGLRVGPVKDQLYVAELLSV
jgi:hypothetical protein